MPTDSPKSNEKTIYTGMDLRNEFVTPLQYLIIMILKEKPQTGLDLMYSLKEKGVMWTGAAARNYLQTLSNRNLVSPTQSMNVVLKVTEKALKMADTAYHFYKDNYR